MCFCTPNNRTPNCGSTECERLAAAADSFSLEVAQPEPLQPKPEQDKLEIPAFLRRTNAEASEAPKDEAPEENTGDGVVHVPLPGLPEETPAEAVEEELPPEPAAPTLNDILALIAKLSVKEAEIAERKRMLKVQARKMVDRL